MKSVNFAIFSNAQGRSREVWSEKQLMNKYPEAKNLHEAAEKEAATWDIDPIVEIHQGYEDMQDAINDLKGLIYATLMITVPNAMNLYKNIDFEDLISCMIYSAYVNQTPYYYFDDDLDTDELIEMVRESQK